MFWFSPDPRVIYGEAEERLYLLQMFSEPVFYVLGKPNEETV